MKEAVKKHYNALQINNEFDDVVAEPPVMCFCRSKNLKYFLWKKTIVNKRVHEIKTARKKR